MTAYIARLEEIEKIPRSNSPYDYHSKRAANQFGSFLRREEIEMIPRSNSPYDYHSKRAPREASNVAKVPTIQQEDFSEACGSEACPAKSAKTETQGQSMKCPQDHNMEWQKHQWYCKRCLLADEAAGLNDPWGFSSAGNSRSPSAERLE
ncbi:hypothetical protein NA57DRAFT_76305 [Rhizodiscina lignyota]|uniref:Uncharacterized protein n=1 Tax=Rhizodiscina lignyota TaxID=1504668 RepID=A0A9P4MAU6_9PEZI|nr:hypothetical protein NA57DRAFT_76305 [Rhizodiscina lignyota]